MKCKLCGKKLGFLGFIGHWTFYRHFRSRHHVELMMMIQAKTELRRLISEYGYPKDGQGL